MLKSKQDEWKTLREENTNLKEQLMQTSADLKTVVEDTSKIKEYQDATEFFKEQMRKAKAEKHKMQLDFDKLKKIKETQTAEISEGKQKYENVMSKLKL